MEAVLTTPFPVLAIIMWGLAVTILLSRWWRRTAAARPTMDGPGRLLFPPRDSRLPMVLSPPRALTTSRLARRIGAGTALVVFGLGYALIAATSYDGQVFYLLAGLLLVIPGCAMVAAAIGGTRRHGVEAAVWMGLVSGLLIFAVHMVVPMLGLQIDAALADEGYRPGAPPDLGLGLPTMLGRELGGGIFALLLLPGWALFLGLISSAGWRPVPESTAPLQGGGTSQS